MSSTWYLHRLEAFPALKKRFLELGYVSVYPDALSDEDRLVWQLLTFDYYYHYSDSLSTWRAGENTKKRILEQIVQMPEDHPLRTLDGDELNEAKVLDLVSVHYPHLKEAHNNASWRYATFLELIGIDADLQERVLSVLGRIYPILREINERPGLAKALAKTDRLAVAYENGEGIGGPSFIESRAYASRCSKNQADLARFHYGISLPSFIKDAFNELLSVYPEWFKDITHKYPFPATVINAIANQLPKDQQLTMSVTDESPYVSKSLSVKRSLNYTHLMTLSSNQGYIWKLHAFINITELWCNQVPTE